MSDMSYMSDMHNNIWLLYITRESTYSLDTIEFYKEEGGNDGKIKELAGGIYLISEEASK